MRELKFHWAKRVVPGNAPRVPYGYSSSPVVELVDGKEVKYYVPDPEVTVFVEEAFQSIENGTSLRDAAAWLTLKTDRPISHVALDKMWYAIVVEPEKTFRQERLDNWKKPKTRAEKKARRLVRQKANARSSITKMKNKIDRLEGRVKETPSPPSNKDLTYEYSSSIGVNSLLGPDTSTQTEVLFRPNPGPQTSFLAASEQEVLYGGAAGGEPKSWFYRLPFRVIDQNKNYVNCWKPEEGNQHPSP